MSTKKFTRKDYLNGVCNHREYYSQFVTPQIISMVSGTFSLDRLQNAYEIDSHFNNIPLAEFDWLPLGNDSVKLMKEAGDYLTMAGKVCILKEAALQAIES